MPKARVHELARELGVDIKDIINYLSGLGADVRNQMSTVDERYAELARKRFTPTSNPVPAVEPIKPRPVGMPPRQRRRPGRRVQPQTTSATESESKATPTSLQKAVSAPVPKVVAPSPETKQVAEEDKKETKGTKQPPAITKAETVQPEPKRQSVAATDQANKPQTPVSSKEKPAPKKQAKPSEAKPDGAAASVGQTQRPGDKPEADTRKSSKTATPARTGSAKKASDTGRRSPKQNGSEGKQDKLHEKPKGLRQGVVMDDDQKQDDTPPRKARSRRSGSDGRSARSTGVASTAATTKTGSGRAAQSKAGGGKPGASKRPGAGHTAARPAARRKPAPAKKAEPVDEGPKLIEIPETISVAELANKLDQPASAVILALMEQGVMAAINNVIDYEVAANVAEKMGALVVQTEVTEKKPSTAALDEEGGLVARPPVVTILGHVDHGKTTLLDAIRETHVVESEAGGITQHIGAYQVVKDERKITFLDTPGHEAFTEMRSRGAHITDIAVLVVAADDGVMPQTIEAINHVKAAKVPIIVAVNKIDRVGASPDRVKQQLADHGLLAEDWGGDTVMVHVSALKKQGIDELLEMILLVADIQELKANPQRAGTGTVIEAELDKNRGPIATVLVQNGTLRVGDALVAGIVAGRIRAMFDHTGKPIKEAGPSTPCTVLGLEDVPAAGDSVQGMDDDRAARQLAEERAEQKRLADQRAGRLRLSELFAMIQEGEIKDLNIVLKADVQGSVEALTSSLEKLSDENVRINVIHGGTGGITESDVALAATSNAVIIGFNVRPEPATRRAAEREGVDIRLYRIIYDAIEDVKAAMTGMLEPTYEEIVLGRAEVRATFKVPGVGMIAGCHVTDGKMVRNAAVRVLRDSVIIFEGKISSLKRFKDDVREVAEGYECGIGVERYNDIKENDVLEAYQMQEVKA
ncbi:MAG TPA: translation initiation factor IF-2 [Firmicutes bacterium]|nr:translation initiation factor IF-2 [Bacillota bacterium]